MWMNADPSKMNMQPSMQEEEDVDDEEMGVAETYADYMPTKRAFEYCISLKIIIWLF